MADLASATAAVVPGRSGCGGQRDDRLRRSRVVQRGRRGGTLLPLHGWSPTVRPGALRDDGLTSGSPYLRWRGSAPALLAFAADAGAFAALRGEDVGVAGVGVAPPQVCLQVAGERGVVGRVRAGHGEGAQRPELWLYGVGPGRAGRG